MFGAWLCRRAHLGHGDSGFRCVCFSSTMPLTTLCLRSLGSNLANEPTASSRWKAKLGVMGSSAAVHTKLD